MEEAGTPWAGTEVGILRSQGRASQTASSGDQILQPRVHLSDYSCNDYFLPTNSNHHCHHQIAHHFIHLSSPVGVASCSLGLAEPGQLEPLP